MSQLEIKQTVKPTTKNFVIIVSVVCNYYGLDIEQLRMRDRREKTVRCRQMICYITRKYLKGYKTTEIGKAISQDHSNVSFSAKVMQTRIDKKDIIVGWGFDAATDYYNIKQLLGIC